MEQYFTRARASEGIKIFLTDVATGKISDDFLIIRSVWSDEYQEAKELAVQRAFTDSRDLPKDEQRALGKKRKLELVSALVAGWSFPQEFTHENVIEFLTEAVHIPDQIDKTSTQNHRFFGKASKDLVSGQKKK